MNKLVSYLLGLLGAILFLVGVWAIGGFTEGLWWKFIVSAVIVCVAAILVAANDPQERL